MRTDFLEIEHKYIVAPDYDADALGVRLVGLGAGPEKRVEVRDTYFYVPGHEGAVFRHRLDRELHQLTVKNRPADSAVRREINLDLAGADAVDTVAAFLETGWGPCVRLELRKSIRVWEVDACEVVHYAARRPDGYTVHCVEFEATGAGSPEAALATLEAIGRACGFDPEHRTRHSLFHLMTEDHGGV
ncbi:MAG: hypothetical protein RLZZ275_160 [Bacteroidota bacterium]